MGSPDLVRAGLTAAEKGPAPEFYIYFWLAVLAGCLVLLYYYWSMEAEQFEVLKLLIVSAITRTASRTVSPGLVE